MTDPDLHPWRRRPWRLIRHGPAPGARNMAVDEAIQTACARGLVPPTLRFYSWRPAALSLGYFQAAGEVNLEVCLSRGIDLVRRPTGGRAILHDREVTYSVVIAEADLPGGVVDTYRLIAAGLHRGLLGLGAPVEVSGVKEASRGASAACFDTASSYELEVRGRKVAGSAQTRRGGTILQHGSIPLVLDSPGLFSLLNLEPDRRASLAGEFAGQAVDLRQATGREIEPEEVHSALERGFSTALGIALAPSGLTVEEEALAVEIEKTKYALESWTFRR